MKRLLMLGGSPNQVVGIKKAKDMGHYVITCDYLENNPGHQFSEEYYNFSTTDKEAILALAKTLKIDGIICYAADSGAATAAFVAEKLGLPSFPYRSIKILSNKDLFRSFLKDNNFNVPKAKGYTSLDEVKAEFHTFALPVIIKPVDSSASRGVSKVNSIELLSEKVEDALYFSRAKRFIIEEYIEKKGYQFGGECFFVNGKLAFSKLVNFHFDIDSINPLLPVGISWPCNNAKGIQEKIFNELQRLIDLLKMQTGPLIFEAQVDYKGNVYIIDIGIQNYGILTQLINEIEGVDLSEYAIKGALGEDCSDLAKANTTGYWAYYTVVSERAGKFKGIELENNIQINNLVKYNQPFIHSGRDVKINEVIGTILFKFTSMNEMLEKMDNMSKWLKVVIDEKF